MHSKDISKIIQRFFSFEPTLDQKALIDKLGVFFNETKNEDAFLIKGYAGTGKTTVVSALVKAFPYIDKKAVLLAPTGRAAKVLSEYSGARAYTIHKKIYRIHTSKDGHTFLTLQQNKHRNTIFIVDEASMIPDMNNKTEAGLFSGRSVLEDLILYINEGVNCNLILIGDTAQLPPVGSDLSPALDRDFLKGAFRLQITEHELTMVVRQAQESGILTNATHLREKIKAESFDVPFFNIQGFEDVRCIGGAELEDCLNSCYSNEERDNVVVICRSNKRANVFNQEIRNRILFQEDEISAGDYMMVLRNNYYWLPEESDTGFIANGDIIEILKIRKIEEIYGFRFADVTVKLIDYPDEKDLEVKIMLDTIMLETPALPFTENRKLWDEISKDFEDIPTKRERMQKVKSSPYLNALQVKYAYSLTCHKTQGGQWNTVFVDQGYLTKEMINIEFLRWLYTATTRAIKKLYFINFADYFFEG
ncbi:MAG: AAA family ATPase [Bacteroidetes bacterium]|nr:AAA family ATPase [Bacteroidota bacterium]